MNRKRPEPFKANPFTLLPEVKLVAVPNAPETHEPMKPLRSYLTKGTDALASLLGDLSGGGRKAPKKVEVERRVMVEVPEVASTGDEEAAVLPARGSRRR